VGLVWLALVAENDTVSTQRVEIRGDREAVASRAASLALGILWRHLATREPTGIPPA
jgi:nicotinamide mononucleotide (NMN) deamidase PncC